MEYFGILLYFWLAQKLRWHTIVGWDQGSSISHNVGSLVQQRIVPPPTQLSNDIQDEKLVLSQEPNSILNIPQCILAWF